MLTSSSNALKIIQFPVKVLPPVPEFDNLDYEDDDRTARQQTVYPVKEIEYIDRICEYLLYNNTDKNHPKYSNRRNCAAFSIGCHLSLRGGDLCKMKVRDFFDNNNEWALKKTFIEQKTGKSRTIYYNQKVIELVARWIESEHLQYDDYLFKSKRAWKDDNGEYHKYMNRHSFGVDLKNAGKAIGYPLPLGTHSMRKTFCYHAYMNAEDKDKSQVLVVLQRLLNHTSPLITMRYLGFEDSDVQDMFMGTDLCTCIY